MGESSESKPAKHGGRRPGAGRKPNLARRLLKGFSRDAIAEAMANVDVGMVVTSLLKSKREKTRLETLIFVRDTLMKHSTRQAHILRWTAYDPKYFNMRAHMWGKLKDWLLSSAIDDDPRLECDLMGPGYELDTKVRIKLERKEEMKNRGLDSPDDADALALTFAQRVAVPAPEVRHRTFSDVTQWS